MNRLQPLFFAAFLALVLVNCKSTSSPENATTYYPTTMEVYSGSSHFHLQEGVDSRATYNWMAYSTDGMHNYERIGIGQLPKGGYVPIDLAPPTLTISFLSDWRNKTMPNDQDLLYWVGSYDYAHSIDTGTGVMIHWVDANKKEWDTNLGTGDQTGSQFFITKFLTGDFQPFPGIEGYKRRTEGTFSCTLYDSLGNSMRIDSARFSFVNGWRTDR